MNTNTLVKVAPLPDILGSRRFALALATIVTLLAVLALPARAEDQPAAMAPAPAGDLPPVNHLVYLEKLPTPAALVKEAAAKGMIIQRIDRTDDSVVVTYAYADGHTDTTGYTTLTAASTEAEPAVVAAAPGTPPPTATTVVSPPPTYTVIYRDPAPVYYGRSYYYDDPFWAPLALGIGIGWVSGGHGGYRGHGGFSHGHGGWRH